MAANWPILALSVSEKLVYRFHFLALCCLARFSNTRFVLPFALRVASAPNPVSLWLGNGVVRLEKKTQLPKNIGAYSATFTVVIATTQGRKHPLLLLLLEQLANVHWFDVDVSVNHTYQEPPPQI